MPDIQNDAMRRSMLGFGCGSVLGRVGRSASLHAMAAAWDAGITLFDTARSYGFGKAEAVLGEFLKGKRDKAVVYTKYGISPEKPSPLKRFAVPAARAALKLPGIAGLKRGAINRQVKYGQFGVQGLRESLETSLRELQTDFIDVLFLHEATVDTIHDDELVAELSAIIRAGKVLRVGVYGRKNVIAEALKAGDEVLSVMQFGADYFDPEIGGFQREKAAETLLIGNHPFGSKERMERFRAALSRLSHEEETPSTLREILREDTWPMLLRAMFGVVLNGSGLHALVFSMMREDHLRANVRAIEENRFSSAEIALIRSYLLRSIEHI